MPNPTTMTRIRTRPEQWPAEAPEAMIKSYYQIDK